MALQFFEGLKLDQSDEASPGKRCSHAISLYYIVKILVQFADDLRFLSGDLYREIENAIEFYTSRLTQVTEADLAKDDVIYQLECLFRLLRCRILVDSLCCRFSFYARNTDPINNIFQSSNVLEVALTRSLEICKSVVALLCTSF